MIVILSPSKTLDMTATERSIETTLPELRSQTKQLAAVMKAKSAAEIARLMQVSPALASLNHERFQAFRLPYPKGEAKAALQAFRGDVYTPIPVDAYTAGDWRFADDHLRILSGFYGLLRPRDAIMAYRLEMGLPLVTPRGGSLYDFWGDRITAALNAALAAQGDDLVINLASQEYAKAIRRPVLKGRVIDVQFKEQQGDAAPRIVALFAKKARGMMADYAVRRRIADPAGLRRFAVGGYRFRASLSDQATLVFVRRSEG